MVDNSSRSTMIDDTNSTRKSTNDGTEIGILMLIAFYLLIQYQKVYLVNRLLIVNNDYSYRTSM